MKNSPISRIYTYRTKCVIVIFCILYFIFPNVQLYTSYNILQDHACSNLNAVTDVIQCLLPIYPCTQLCVFVIAYDVFKHDSQPCAHICASRLAFVKFLAMLQACIAIFTGSLVATLNSTLSECTHSEIILNQQWLMPNSSSNQQLTYIPTCLL